MVTAENESGRDVSPKTAAGESGFLGTGKSAKLEV
jgi:hypothetical protein